VPLSPTTKLLGAAAGAAVLLVGGLLIRYAGTPAERASDAPTPPATTSVTPAEVVPSRNPRQDPDVDRGTPINYGVFVEVPLTWGPESVDGVVVSSLGRGVAAFFVSNHPVASTGLLRSDVQGFADTAAIGAVKFGAVRQLPLPNRNISEAVQLSYTSSYTDDDGVLQPIVGACTRFRGVATINDVSVSICYASRSAALDVVRADVAAMTASVARSI
jgi:hypothetical protein